jgi:hypothetical protein
MTFKLNGGLREREKNDASTTTLRSTGMSTATKQFNDRAIVPIQNFELMIENIDVQYFNSNQF